MKFWKNNPGIRLLFPFLFGIIGAVQSGITISNEIVILVICALLGFVYWKFSSYRLRKINGIIISTTLFLIGFQYTVSRTEKYQESHFSNILNEVDYYKVKVIEGMKEKESSYKTTLQILQIDSSLQSYSGKVLAYFRKSDQVKDLKYGDELIIKNSINAVEGAKNPNQFNYKHYLNLNQINYQVFLDTNSWKETKKNSGNILYAFSQKMRRKLYQYLEDNGVEGKQLKVGSALLLGYRENLDKDLMKSYSSAGAMHVLAVSGLHVGILYLLLSNFFNLFKRLKNSKYFIAFLLISLLWFYALMTGLSASVMRASTMFTFIIIGDKLLNRATSIYNTLAVSAIVLLVINPYIAFQVGFQLSYAAVLGIVYLQPKIYKWVYFNNKILQKIWSITCVSLAAQIATFPLGLYYFHQFPVYFFVSNLVVIPAAILIFYLGIALFITAPFSSISIPIGKLLNFILYLLNEAIFFTEGLAYSLIEEISISIVETVLMYLIILISLFALHYRKSKLFYLSFSLCFGFVCIQLVSQFNSTQQSYMTFYSVKNESVFEMANGKKVYFVSSQGLKNDWNTMLFNVNNNWNYHNISTKVYLNVDSIQTTFKDDNLIKNKDVFYFKNKVIQLLNENSKTTINPNYLMVNKKSLRYLKKYLKQSTPITLVFDSTIPEYKLKYYKTLIDIDQTKIVCLDKESFIVNLEN